MSINRKKEIDITCPESQVMYDLAIRTERLYRHLRKNAGVGIPIETFTKWQEAHESVMVHYAELLESMAIDIDKPDLYNDSLYISAIKEKALKKP